MIVVESKKSKRATIEKRYPNAVIIDVTSRSEDEYVKFSPFIRMAESLYLILKEYMGKV